MDWINVKDKLPIIKNGISDRLIVLCDEDEKIFEANYFEDFNGKSGWRDYQNTSELKSVTHWSIKPKRPERSKRENVDTDQFKYCGCTECGDDFGQCDCR